MENLASIMKAASNWVFVKPFCEAARMCTHSQGVRLKKNFEWRMVPSQARDGREIMALQIRRKDLLPWLTTVRKTHLKDPARYQTVLHTVLQNFST